MPPSRRQFTIRKREGVHVFHGTILEGEWTSMSSCFEIGEQWGTASYLTFFEAEEGGKQTTKMDQLWLRVLLTKDKQLPAFHPLKSSKGAPKDLFVRYNDEVDRGACGANVRRSDDSCCASSSLLRHAAR
jgi:hypothetical protein